MALTRKDIPLVKTPNSFTINFQGRQSTLYKDDPRFDEAVSALREERWDDLPSLFDPIKQISTFSNGKMEVKDGEVYILGRKAPSSLNEHILGFMAEKLNFEPLVLFFERLMKNPSFTAVEGLHRFLLANHFPITDDGRFMAYKTVRSDFKDIHSGTFDNSVGKVVEMPRNMVNEDSEQTCSNGLHVAAYSYAHGVYGNGNPTNVTLEVLVDPADVVAVPRDYNDAKMRCCKYEVVGISKGERKDNLVYTSKVNLNKEDICDEELEDEDCEDCGEPLDECDCGDLLEDEEENICPCSACRVNS